MGWDFTGYCARLSSARVVRLVVEAILVLSCDRLLAWWLLPQLHGFTCEDRFNSGFCLVAIARSKPEAWKDYNRYFMLTARSYFTSVYAKALLIDH